MPVISDRAKWMQNGTTVAGGNGQGNGVNQLSNPYGVCIDEDETIYVADNGNHRIVQWKKGATVGQVIAGGNGAGSRNDQLNSVRNVIVDQQNGSLIICDYGNGRVVRWLRQNGTSGETIVTDVSCNGAAMDNDGYLYISDTAKYEVKRWKIGENNGTVVAGGNGSGNRLDQLNTPFYIAVDQDQSVYVSDYGNHRVVKWAKGVKEGVVVAGGQSAGNGLKQLSSPGGIVVDQSGTVYVADYGNSRVVRWLKGAAEGSIVVGAVSYSWNLSFDRQNNLYVLDYGNHRVQKFNIESD